MDTEKKVMSSQDLKEGVKSADYGSKIAIDYYILGSIFASLAFEGRIPHVIFRRKDESSGPRPLSLASRHVRCQSVLGEAASHFRGSRALSPL